MNLVSSVLPVEGCVYEALAKAQAEIHAAVKSGENKFDRYSYAKLEDFYLAAKPVLSKYNLAIAFSTDEVVPLEPRQTQKGGTEHCVRVRITGTVIHGDGSSISVTGWGEGQDRADKAIYKAVTGARKYALAGLLAIPTADDPENDSGTQQQPPRSAPPIKTDAPPAPPTVKERHDSACDKIRKAVGHVKGTIVIATIKENNKGKDREEILRALEDAAFGKLPPEPESPL